MVNEMIVSFGFFVLVCGLFGLLNSSWVNWLLLFDCGFFVGVVKLKVDMYSSNKVVIVFMLFFFSGG